MQIISGSSNSQLASKIAQNTGYKLLNTKIRNFSDGELKVEVNDNIDENVIIVQSTSPPVNDRLIELLLLIDTVKRAGAKNIIAITPYFGYSRQDYCAYKHGPLSASLVIKLLETAGITKLITLDLHSKQLEGVFSVPLINLEPTSVFFPFYDKQDNSGEIVIVSPDIGGINRARNFSSLVNKGLVIVNKTRDSNNQCFAREVIGDVKNKKCIIIDDIVDSATTLCKAAELLKKKGAGTIEAYVTHAVLSSSAKEKIMSSPISRIIVSDSIYHEALPSKFVIARIDQLISCILQP